MGSGVMTLRLTAKCSPGQHRRLDEILGWSCEMYNACVESWKGSYAWWKEHNPGEDQTFPRDMSRYDLFKMFTQVRGEDDRWAGLDCRVGWGVICRFDRARKAFYDRCNTAGKKPGFPRFKSRRRWRSIEIPDATASMVRVPGEGGRWWRLRVKGVPSVRFADRGGRLRTALDQGRLVELRIVRSSVRVELHAVFRLPPVTEPTGEPSNPVGLDKGLRTRLAFCDGRYVNAREPDLAAIKRRQRALSRAKKGSRTRAKKRLALARAWRRETEKARNADYRLAHRLVTDHDGIAVEALHVAGMLRGRRSSKKMSEQRWSALDAILEHKAAKAGIRYVRVNAAYTSTDCSQCGHRQAMPLNKRVYDCGRCGMVLCRDVNAATNICARAFRRLGDRAGKEVETSPGIARVPSTLSAKETDHPPHGCDAGRRYRTVRPEHQLRYISPKRKGVMAARQDPIRDGCVSPRSCRPCARASTWPPPSSGHSGAGSVPASGCRPRNQPGCRP